jgi:hypothetical protein
MGLNQQTSTGLTFGQIISIISLVALGFAAWVNLTNKTTENAARIVALENSYSRVESNQAEIMKENKQDHMILSGKIDETNKLIMDYFTAKR